jgi:hypothetical protein
MIMSISRPLENHAFEPEVITTISAAYDDALRKLGLAKQADPLTEIVAKRIFECALRGERDPVRLRDLALEELQSN